MPLHGCSAPTYTMNIGLRLSFPRLTYVFPFYAHLYKIINIVKCIVAPKHKLVPGPHVQFFFDPHGARLTFLPYICTRVAQK